MGQSENSTYNVARLHSMKSTDGVKVQDFIVNILTAK